MLRILRDTTRERASQIGAAARARVLARHTAAHRAQELEDYLCEAAGVTPMPLAPGRARKGDRPGTRRPAKEKAIA
jgi:hypothetical protein